MNLQYYPLGGLRLLGIMLVDDEQHFIDEMKEKGLEPVVVPETLINRIDDYNQGMKEDAIPIMTTNRYIADMAEKKKYIFIKHTNSKFNNRFKRNLFL